MRTRSRIVYAIESRISARLPPTVCWIEMAVAISSRSSDFTRRTMFSSACSNGRPRLTSRMTRPNSVEMGGRDSRTTSSMACRNDEPALSALAMRVIVSGRFLLKALRRPPFRRPSQRRGRKKPTMPPTRRMSGLRSGGTPTLRKIMISGTPIVEPAQIARNSLTLSLRSARAISRARLAPKSRASTTRLKFAIAALWVSISPRFWLLPAFVSTRPDAYRSRRTLIPEPPPDVAMPAAISRIAIAAAPATAIVMVSTSVSFPRRSVREAEDVRRHVDAHDLELLDELGPDAGRLQAALDLAFDDTGLLEDEDILHDDDITFHTLDFGDVGDLAGAVLEAALQDDEVDGRRDLLTDGPHRQVDAGHEDHRLEARQHVTRAVGVARRHRAVMAGVPGLEHVERPHPT